jgi:hypothetical protein
MRKQAVNQACEKNSMEGVLEALRKSIARWTEKGNQLMTAIPDTTSAFDERVLVWPMRAVAAYQIPECHHSVRIITGDIRR